MSFAMKYMKALSKRFPNKRACCVEIVNLKAILELPRGTEHFISDIHGEFEAFIHVLKNSSGMLRNLVNKSDVLSILSKHERDELLALIYYPSQVMRNTDPKVKTREWYKLQMKRILIVLKAVTFKFTRSKVRKNLPADYGYVIHEMLTERVRGTSHLHKMVESYFDSIADSIIEEGCAEDVITEMSIVIRNLAVEELHIVGDIYDRGPGAEVCLDYLMRKRGMNCDIQFGNHDVLWIGAATGNLACIANVLRISLRYSNLRTLEEGYGISLGELYEFTKKNYGRGPTIPQFHVRNPDPNFSDKHIMLLSRMQKAMFIIQMKLECQVIRKHPEYLMKDRLLFEKIDMKEGTCEIGGKLYKLLDTDFPTVDPEKPEELTKDEFLLMEKLRKHFMESEKLKQHISFLLKIGSMYKIRNNNLLFHASIPITSDVEFCPVILEGQAYKGRALMDKLDRMIRDQYDGRFDPERDDSICFWLWQGSLSPLFGKSKMATFERYYIKEKETHVEKKGIYFLTRDDEKLVNLIFKEFDIKHERGHIIVGHLPVKVKEGERPIRCGGKYITIDGGMSKAYQNVTGIAGYTLIADADGLHLCTHHPFNKEELFKNLRDLESEQTLLDGSQLKVKDTDTGKELSQQIDDLRQLIQLYDQRKIKQSLSKTITFGY